MKQVRVMLADEHPVVRSGLHRYLDDLNNIIVIGNVTSGEQAYRDLPKLRPNVLLINASMPDMGGIETLNRILTRDCKAKVIVFTMDENITFATQALSMGAQGYLSLSDDCDILNKAIIEVAGGRKFLSDSMAKAIALRNMSGSDELIQDLTSREFEIFRLLVEGKVVEKIARLLNISHKTVANYQTVLKQKLGVNSAVELVRLAIRQGVIKP